MSVTNGNKPIRGTSTLVRPRFEPGMLLEHDDLEQISSYTRELNRLMFRSLFGCGVVCGLVVTPKRDCGKDCVVVGAGLALDGNGDPIHVPTNREITIDEHCEPNPTTMWVVLCRWSKSCAPRTAMCPSDEEETSSVCTRERDGYEIRVVQQEPKCICWCEPPEPASGTPTRGGEAFVSECWCVSPTHPCYSDHYAGICGCNCGDCPGGSCDCDCVVLAKLTPPTDNIALWTADHSVRRFVRPVLMRDRQVELERPAIVPPPLIRANVPVSVQPAQKKRVKTPTTPRTPLG